MIAFEPETDFVVSAWLAESKIKMPERGEMIIGSQITPEKEDEVIFFNEPFKVVGHLERSGTNYDTCVFMTYETAQEIMSSEKWYETFRERPDSSQLVSSLMIRAKEGTDVKALARTINFRLAEGFAVGSLHHQRHHVRSHPVTQSMGSYSAILVALIAVLVVVALLCIFTITINERTKEFGILACLGADSGKLARYGPDRRCADRIAGRIFGRCRWNYRTAHL